MIFDKNVRACRKVRKNHVGAWRKGNLLLQSVREFSNTIACRYVESRLMNREVQPRKFLTREW